MIPSHPSSPKRPAGGLVPGHEEDICCPPSMSSPAAGAEDPSWPHRPSTGSVLAARRKSTGVPMPPDGPRGVAMSDPNDKSASILLKKQGKTEAIFLYDFAQFTGQNEDAGLYRAKINGCWHCPTANTRLYQRMPWPLWYATGSPVPRLPGHVRKGWTSPSASSPTGMMTMAEAAGKHGQRHRPTWARMPAGGSG